MLKRKVSTFQTFSALRNRDYRFLWIGSGFTSAAQWIQQITLGWLVLQLTGSPLWVGTVLGIRALPFLVVGPLAGVAVDRVDRKKLFLFTQSFLAVLSFSFAVGVQLEKVNVIHAFIFSFLIGVDSSLNQPVLQSLIVNVVPKKDLTNALALHQSFSAIIRTIAPLVAGTLLSVAGIAGNLYIQGAAYLAVFLIAMPMGTPYREGAATQASMGRNLMEGLAHLKKDFALLLLIVLVFIPSLFMHSTQNLLPVFAEDILKGGPQVLGWLGSSLGAGALIATFLIASLGNFQKKGLVATGSIILMTAFLALFGLSSQLLLSMVLIGFMGFFNTTFRLSNNSLVQGRIPDELRGRITSIYMIDHGFQPLGSFLLGLLAQLYDPGRAVAIAGAVALGVTAFIGLRFRFLWGLK